MLLLPRKGSLAIVHDSMTAMLRAQATYRIKHTVHGPWIGTDNKLEIGIGDNGKKNTGQRDENMNRY